MISQQQLTQGLMMLLMLVLGAIVMKWLWNNSLVPHISILKPITTYMDAFVLSLALTILKCC